MVLRGLYIITTLIEGDGFLTAVQRSVLPAHMKEARLWPMWKERRWVSTVSWPKTAWSLKPWKGCNSLTASRDNFEVLIGGVV